MQLEFQGISKHFTAVKALDKVSMIIRPGEVHAICGENGAGKSTLLNIVTGNVEADEGNILIDGNPVHFFSPREAFSSGIAIVYQHLSLVESLSIAENIFAANPPINRYGFLQPGIMLQKANELLKKLHLDQLDASQPVYTLNAGERQMVEIAKALATNPKIVFFDEPTASVSEKDVQVLFNIIRQLKSEGVAVVYISHRLHEILQLADTITILKDGKSQGSFSAAEMNSDKLIQAMVGREVTRLSKTSSNSQQALLELKNLSGNGFENISFTLHKGEILGMAGLIGAGRTEIAHAIFGFKTASNGSIAIMGNRTTLFNHPLQAMKAGIAYVPEDRKTEGIFPDKTVAENIYITKLAVNKYFNLKSFEHSAETSCKSLQVKTTSIEKKAGELSGGNQQKLMLGRWLHTNPDILILDEPTHGIDIGAKFEIYQLIQQLSAGGKGILLISSELSELINLCDKIMVIREGKIAGILNNDEATEEKILALAMQEHLLKHPAHE